MAECIEEGTLRAYADGALMPEQEAVVSAHVAHCARCSRNLVALNALASEVSSFVIDNSYVPDPRIALAQVRSMMPAAETHPAADISRAPFVAFTGEAQKRRVSPGLCAYSLSLWAPGWVRRWWLCCCCSSR